MQIVGQEEAALRKVLDGLLRAQEQKGMCILNHQQVATLLDYIAGVERELERLQALPPQESEENRFTIGTCAECAFWKRHDKDSGSCKNEFTLDSMAEVFQVRDTFGCRYWKARE